MSIAIPKNYALGSPNIRAFPKVQYDKIKEIVNAINGILAGTTTITDVEVSDGTVALPAITFASDLSTGLYRIGTSEIGLTLAGTKSVDFAVNLTTFTGVVKATTSVLSPLIDTATAVAMTIGTTATSLTITPNTTVSGTLASGTLTVTGAASTTTTLGAGTALTVGTDETFAKEVNHNIIVATTTTAATVGGSLALSAATGATSGNGGALTLNGGTGGATAGSIGGAVSLISGPSGGGGGASGSASISTSLGTTSGLISVSTGAASAGASGNISITSGAGTSSTGAITITTGNASAGAAGNIILTPGTTSSTTISPIVVSTTNIIEKSLNTNTIATGQTLTGKQLVDGYIAITGATGNVQFPTAALITAAIGSSPAGTMFECIINASGMTATNVATFTVNTNLTFLKQVSSGDSAVSALATVTQTAGTHIGVFRFVFDTATTVVVSRVI